MERWSREASPRSGAAPGRSRRRRCARSSPASRSSGRRRGAAARRRRLPADRQRRPGPGGRGREADRRPDRDRDRRARAARPTPRPPRADARQVDRLLGDVVRDPLVRVKVWTEDGTIVYSDEPRLIGSQYELGDDELEALGRRRRGRAQRPERAGEPLRARPGPAARGLLPDHRPRRRPAPVRVLLALRRRHLDRPRHPARDRPGAARRARRCSRFVQIPLAARMARRIRDDYAAPRGAAAPRRRRLRPRAPPDRRRPPRRRRPGAGRDDLLARRARGEARDRARGPRRPARGRRDDARLDPRAAHDAGRDLPGQPRRGRRPRERDRRPAGAAADRRRRRRARFEADVAAISIEGRQLVYRVAQEALRNVEKHARASEVSVLVEDRDRGVRVTVADDGVGFDPEAPRPQQERRATSASR